MTDVDDDHVRARAKDVDAPLAIVAGAGAGKTTVLVERLLAALAKHPARAIAAVTFTEKAAGEIAARVRARTAEVAPARLPELTQLTVTTLHGFARRLLLHEAFVSGFPPGADVAVGGAAAADERAVRDEIIAVFVRGLRKDNRTLWRVVERLVTPSQLRRAVDVLLIDAADCALDLAAPPPPAEGGGDDVRALVAALERARAAAAACTMPEDKLRLAWQALDDELLEAAAAGPVDLYVAAATHPALSVRKNLGQKAAWPNDSKKELIDAVAALGAWQAAAREQAHGELVARLVRDVVPQLRDERRARGLVGFDDLLLRAQELLEGDVAARRRLADRFRVVLVDEVQDTDPIQARIAQHLTRDLFVVGDPKQAIYRFRGGDVDTFHQTAGLVAERRALTKNFRAVPGLVAWLNHTFATLPGFVAQTAVRPAAALPPVVALSVDTAAPAQVSAAAEHARRRAPADGDGDGGGEPDDDSDSEDVLANAAAVAAHVKTLLSPSADGQASARVVDAKTRALRPLTPKDVMVVLPSWSAADAIADAFGARGIPSVIDGGDRLFARDEMRVALATLRAIVDGSDSEAVLLCLRGAFGCTLSELWNHKAGGGSFRPRPPLPPPTSSPATSALPSPAAALAGTRVDKALAALAAAARRAGTSSLARLVEELLWAGPLPAWAIFHDGDRRRANLDRFFALVEEHELRTRSPLEVVSAMMHEATREDHTDQPRLDDDGAAARITTLFSAKGLEAPLVVVAGQARRREGSSAIVDRLHKRASVKVGELTPPGWGQARARDIQLDDEERRRWVYVACTRARDQLVLVPPWGRLLAPDVRARGLPPSLDEVAHDTDAPLLEDAQGIRVRVERASALEAAAGGPVAPRWFVDARGDDLDGAVAALAMDRALTSFIGAAAMPQDDDGVARAIAVARRACRRWRTVSEVVRSRRLAVDAVVDDGPAASSIGAVGGRLVHRVMERLDFTLATDARAAQARALCAQLALDNNVDARVIERAASVCERLARHPVVERAGRALAAGGAARLWREVPFAVPGGGARTTTSGTIDLVFVEPGAVVVVDWKSDVPPEGSPLRARYEAQLAEYARAVVRALDPKLPVETILAGPHPELPLDDDDVYAFVPDDARAVLEALVARGAPAPIVGYVEAGVETLCAWPDLVPRLALVEKEADAADVAALEKAGYVVTADVDEVAARLAPPEDAPAGADDGS